VAYDAAPNEKRVRQQEEEKHRQECHDGLAHPSDIQGHEDQDESELDDVFQPMPPDWQKLNSASPAAAIEIVMVRT